MSEKAKEDEILKLVQRVDSKFGFHIYDIFIHGSMAFPLDVLFVLLIIVEIYLLSAPTKEQLAVALPFIGIIIGFFALMFRSIEETVVDINFKRLGMCVDKNKQPLLKALIKMKFKNPKFRLEQIYKMNKSMFSPEKLLKRLYE